MSQRTFGLYRLVQFPHLYEAIQSALGARRSRQQLVDQYICPGQNSRVLDLGCGPSAIRPFLGDISYVGIDLNPAHIDRARLDHGDGGRFHVGDFGSLRDELEESFDTVLCIGLLHHLDDHRVTELCQLAYDYLISGGRLVTVDPVFQDGQARIARWMAAADSGECVRTEADYRELLAPHFEQCQTHVRHDLLRIPYSHCIMIATKRGDAH